MWITTQQANIHLMIDIPDFNWTDKEIKISPHIPPTWVPPTTTHGSSSMPHVPSGTMPVGHLQ